METFPLLSPAPPLLPSTGDLIMMGEAHDHLLGSMIHEDS